MKEIISKELLKEVLGYRAIYENLSIMEMSDNILYFGYDNINIYELAHRCKEWALTKEYWITSGIQNRNEIADYDGFCLIKDFNHDLEDFMKTGSSECEAIFKATQWILDNKEK